MRKLIKHFFIFIMIIFMIIVLSIGGCLGYIGYKMHEYQAPYTETVEQVLMDLVPEEGITVEGRTYSNWSVYNFLEEIRYDPYNYIHKDHHCVLQYVPQRYIYWIVTGLRTVMGCGNFHFFSWLK